MTSTRARILALAPILVLLALGGCAAQREDPPSTAELVSLGAQNLPSFPRSRPHRLFPNARATFPRFRVSTRFPVSAFRAARGGFVFRVVSTLSDPSEEKEVTRSEKQQNKTTPLQTFHLQLTAALVPGITIRVPIHPPQWAEYLNIDPAEADDTAVRFTPEEKPRGPYWPGEYPDLSYVVDTYFPYEYAIRLTNRRPPLIVPPQIPTTSSWTSTPRART